MIDFKTELAKFFKGDIDTTDETLSKYSHDASIFEMRPQVVVYPKDSEDIQNLVQWVNDNKQAHPELSITARAAGTCMSGGPINESIIMDFMRHMNKIHEVKRVSPYVITPMFPTAEQCIVTGEAIVEPGIFYRDFEPETAKLGLVLPTYTASKSVNALGGMIGNNSAGELTLRYGQTADYVRSLNVVLSDGHEYIFRPITRRELYTKIAQVDLEGQVYKKIFDIIKENELLIKSARPMTSKNATGYGIWNVFQKGKTDDEDIFDINRIIVGAQGTLGIATKATLALVDKPTTSKLVVVFLTKLDKLGDIVDTILTTKPLTVESYDDKTFKIAMKFFKDFLKTKGFWNTIMFGLSFIPEFWMILTGGIPKLILLVEYDGKTAEDVQSKCQNLMRTIAPFALTSRITRDEKEASKYWDMRRDSFALLRKHVQGRRTAPFIDDIIVSPHVLPEFLPKLQAILNEYTDIIYTIAGHAGNGNFHIIPLMDFNSEKTIPEILELSDRVYDLVVSYKGSISAEHNDGLVRTPYLIKMYGEQMIALFKQIKTAFDPKNIFNPKKKVGTTIEDIQKYVIKPDAPHVSHGS